MSTHVFGVRIKLSDYVSPITETAAIGLYNTSADLNDDAASGQADVVVANVVTVDWQDGDIVYLYDDNNEEFNRISSIAIGASTTTLTLVNNLTNAYTTAANAHINASSQLRWIQNSVSNSGITWRDDMLVPNGIEEIIRNIDLKSGGNIAELGGSSVKVKNTDQLWNTLANTLDVYLAGKSVDIVYFENTTETILWQGICQQPAWTRTLYKIPVRSNRKNRNANIVTEQNVEGVDDKVVIPVTFGNLGTVKGVFTAKSLSVITFSYLYPGDSVLTNETVVKIDAKYSADLDSAEYILWAHNYSFDGTNSSRSSQWDDIFSNPTDYAIKVVSQKPDPDIVLYTDSSSSSVTDGSANVGSYRRLSNVQEFIIAGGQYDGYEGFRLTLESEFSAPLGANSAYGESNCFIEFYKIDWQWAIDTVQCVGFDTTDDEGYLLEYNSDTTQYDPVPAGIVRSTTEDRLLALEPDGMIRNLNHINWVSVRNVPISFCGLSEFKYKPSWIADALTMYQLRKTTGEITNFYGSDTNDKVNEYAHHLAADGSTYEGTPDANTAILTTNGGAAAAGFAWVISLGNISTLLFENDIKYDNAYLLFDTSQRWWSATGNSAAICLGAYLKDNETMHVIEDKTQGGWFYISNLHDDLLKKDRYWFDRKTTIVKNTNSYIYGNPVTMNMHTGYSLFELNVEEYKDVAQSLYLIYTNSEAISDATFAYDNYTSPQLVLTRTVDVSDLYAKISGGREFNDSWGGRVTATDMISSPLDLYEALCRMQCWYTYGSEPAGGWGKAYFDNARIKISGDGSFESNTLEKFNRETTQYGAAIQITDKSKGWTDILRAQLAREFGLIGWVDNNGYECVRKLPDNKYDLETPDETITFNDIQRADSQIKISEPDIAHIYAEPFVRYNKHSATGKYQSIISVTGVTGADTNFDGSTHVTGNYVGSPELLWNDCVKLYKISGIIQKPPSALTDLWFANGGGESADIIASQYIQRWIYWSRLRQCNFKVNFLCTAGSGAATPVRQWQEGQRFKLILPHETNAITIECLVYRIKINPNPPYHITVGAWLLDEALLEEDDNIIDTYNENIDQWQDSYDTVVESGGTTDEDIEDTC